MEHDQDSVKHLLTRILYTLEDNPLDQNHKGLGTQLSEFRQEFKEHTDEIDERMNDFHERLTKVEKNQSQWKVTLVKVAAFFGLSGSGVSVAWLKWETFIEFLKTLGKV